MTIARSTSRPVVVGYDGRPTGDDALALARLLARVTGHPLVVVSALDRVHPEVAPSDYETELRDEGDRLARVARSTLGDVGPVETVTVHSTSPARELIAEAIEREAVAIVIGSSHRGRVGRVLPGGVGERMLSGAPCALLLAPHGFAQREHPELRRVGVAYDGSPEAMLALTEALAIVRESGSSLRLIFALHEGELVGPGWGGIAPLVPSPIEELRAQRRWLERELSRVVNDLPDRVSAEAEVIDGRPVSVLIDASRDLDLLILGSRSYGPVKRVLFGGVSGAVARDAACPLLVTPRSSVGERPSPRVTEGAAGPPRIRALDDAG